MESPSPGMGRPLGDVLVSHRPVRVGVGEVRIIRLAGSFSLSDPDSQVIDLDASEQPWEELTPVLVLRHDKLTSLIVTDDAQLTVKFASGHTVTAEADERPYEHWEVTAPGIKLIARPGNRVPGVAVWRDD